MTKMSYRQMVNYQKLQKLKALRKEKNGSLDDFEDPDRTLLL